MTVTHNPDPPCCTVLYRKDKEGTNGMVEKEHLQSKHRVENGFLFWRRLGESDENENTGSKNGKDAVNELAVIFSYVNKAFAFWRAAAE